MAPTMLEELCKRIQHCCATLRRSRNKISVGSCWLKSLTGFKLCATTPNNMQQAVQTDATCNIQHWELLANNVASVCTGLNTFNVIYLVECHLCNLQYIVETKRRLKDHFNEHIRPVFNPSDSYIQTTV